MPKDTKTRYTGVYARHKTGCCVEVGGACSCKPSYWGQVWDGAAQKRRPTKFFDKPSEADHARADLRADLRAGRIPASESLPVRRGVELFLQAAERGVVLNKHGRRYKASALRDVRGALENHVVVELGARRMSDVRRGDVQRLVDRLVPKMSGSRIRTVVNSIHTLYRWAQAREIVYHDPAALVQLPAMNAKPRDRVATPAELEKLLDALEPADALPYAIAAYATARRAEIRHVRVGDVDLKRGVIYLGVDEHARKSVAARRAVPIVKPLRVRLRRDFMERGRPAEGDLLCPGRKGGGRNSGMLSFEALQARADALVTSAAV
jgi:integrase